MKNSLKTDLLFVVGMIMLLTGAYLTLSSWAFGAEPPNIVNTDDAATAAYWTSSRMAAIRPMPLPQADVPIPSLFGTQGLRFTSSRLTYDSQPLGDTKYPNSIGGQLSLTIPGEGDFVCSATVQKLSVIVTAGHCVADGLGHFYTNWLFVPGIRKGVHMMGQYSWHQVFTTPDWFDGGGTVPNAQDVAVIVLSPKMDGSGRQAGELTGVAGLAALPDLSAGQHLTVLGYPCNLDNCAVDHRTDAQAVSFVENTDIIGSDSSGGASGGGWFVNYGEFSEGSPGSGNDATPNALVAVTSFGFTRPEIMAIGASILDSRYVAILNAACSANPGAC